MELKTKSLQSGESSVAFGIETYDSAGSLLFSNANANASLVMMKRVLISPGQVDYTDTDIPNNYFFIAPADGYTSLQTQRTETDLISALSGNKVTFGGAGTKNPHLSMAYYLYLLKGISTFSIPASTSFGMEVTNDAGAVVISNQASNVQIWEDNTITVSRAGTYMGGGSSGGSYASISLFTATFNRVYTSPPFIAVSHADSSSFIKETAGGFKGIVFWHFLKNTNGEYIGFVFGAPYAYSSVTLRYRVLAASNWISGPAESPFGLAAYDSSGARVWNSDRPSMTFRAHGTWNGSTWDTYDDPWAMLTLHGGSVLTSSKIGTDNYDIFQAGLWYEAGYGWRFYQSVGYVHIGSTSNIQSAIYTSLSGGFFCVSSPTP